MEAEYVLDGKDIQRIKNRVGDNKHFISLFNDPIIKEGAPRPKLYAFGTVRNGKYFIIQLYDFPKMVFYRVLEVNETNLKRISGASLPV